MIWQILENWFDVVKEQERERDVPGICPKCGDGLSHNKIYPCEDQCPIPDNTSKQ